jgi:hypothetical protein
MVDEGIYAHGDLNVCPNMQTQADDTVALVYRLLPLFVCNRSRGQMTV